MVTVIYEATDGTLFVTHKGARDHDEDLFDKWLQSKPLIDVLSVLRTLDNTKNEDCGGTAYDQGIEFVKRAWEQSCK